MHITLIQMKIGQLCVFRHTIHLIKIDITRSINNLVLAKLYTKLAPRSPSTNYTT